MQERRNQFIEVLEQIRKFSHELYNDSIYTPSSIVVDESDLSIRKLGQLHSELRDLQQDKDDRLNHVLDLLKTVHSLCKVLGLDFEETVAKVHPSLGVDFEGKKSLTNKTIMGLTSTIQRLRNVKMKRVQRFKEKANAAVIIQTHWRRHKAYSSYRHLQKAAIIFQYSWRRRVAWKELEKFKMAARVPKVERIDLIGVDNFLCVLPPYFVDLVNNLKMGIIWSSCSEELKFESHARVLIYSQVLDSLAWTNSVSPI
ncbi:microtubule-associated protein 65-9 [Actinidia rufa]|uniref:Microtubule-associated protein 65-9 n=1 Tax=Actinidia rufa TaxID=165716 RepID=A0A7J0H013_9ERIC|nr:microtubule-associated protein 65-9 [Actinidia rufa]